jgi:hypothetical protein
MFQCLSHGYDPNRFLSFIAAFRKDNDGEPSACHANADPSILSIVASVIRGNQHGGNKHGRRIEEVETVPSDVFLSFILIPFKLHSEYCMYKL